MPVGVGVAVPVFVGVAVCVPVGVGVLVPGVFEGVAVVVVGVPLGVFVGVLLGVFVGVFVGVLVLVEVAVEPTVMVPELKVPVMVTPMPERSPDMFTLVEPTVAPWNVMVKRVHAWPVAGHALAVPKAEPTISMDPALLEGENTSPNAELTATSPG